MTVSPQSRIKLTDVAPLAPGTCALCGSAGGDGRKFIDFGKQLDWFGAVYFCSYCVGETANAVDYVHRDWLENLKADYTALKSEHELLKSQFKALKYGYLHLFSDPGIITNFDDLLSGIIAHMEKSEHPERDVKSSSENESKSSERDNVGGSTDTIDLADFDDEAGF